MKKFFLLLSAFCFFAAVQAQTPAATTAPATTTKATTTKATTATPADKEVAKPVEHVCTAACKTGTHIYAHGEKGHACTSACAAPKTTKKAVKPTTKPVQTDSKAAAPKAK
ncbi:MAG: hypothetical protein IPG55_08120 [Saprospiraceae bacterium]|nr:hypothetical protein [Candidatus Defluviibacterium haderslevense]